MTSPIAHRLLLLDLREKRRLPLPDIAGLEPVNPAPGSNCDIALSAVAVLVAIDSERAYSDWRQRYHPMCPCGFPHIVLLDPYDPGLARRTLADDAADCCAMDDVERLQLIVSRLLRPLAAKNQVWIPSPVDPASHLRLQTTLDTLPSPIFIKNRSGRYIACNKAFEQYLGLPHSQIIGASVFDIAPEELARVYEKADQELLAPGGNQSYETRVRYADGTLRDVIFHKSVFLDANGQPEGISGTILDITERKTLEQKLAHAAATDFLTGVYNLRTFYELGSREFRRHVRHGGELSLIIIDLDYFKDINDRLGHAAGDDALRVFVAIVQSQLRDQDIFARAGGDEFRVLLPDTLPSGAAMVAERMRKAVSEQTVSSARGTAQLSISVGICSCLPGDESLEDATKRADAALYMAKAAGRNAIHPTFTSV